MNEHRQNRDWYGAGRRGLAAAVLVGVLAARCGRPAAPPTDSKSLKEHAEELKRQHTREMKNK